MNKITFTKISENHYLASNVEWIIEKCRDILVELSDNDLDKFEVSTNNRLFYTILARRLGSEFFKEYTLGNLQLNKAYPFALVSIEGFGFVDFSFGITIQKNKELRVTDVLYR